MESSAPASPSHSIIHIPRHLLLFLLITGEAMPFLARLPGAAFQGWDWLTDYFLGMKGMLFFGTLNLIPIVVLYAIGKASKRQPLSFWFALIASYSFLIWSHGTFNTRASSTAVIGLVLFPPFGACAAIFGWFIGFVTHLQLGTEQAHRSLVGTVAAVASILSVGSIVYEAQTVAKQESRFPIVSVNEIALQKRPILACCPQGRVEVLRLGNFDIDSSAEIAVLGDSGVTLLEPGTYKVKRTFDFNAAGCRHQCLGMYPDVVPDGTGSFLVTSSEGVRNSQGHVVWKLHSQGFARLVPMKISGSNGVTFFATPDQDRIERQDIKGNTLWTVKLSASNIGPFVSSAGQSFLFAVTSAGERSWMLQLYSPDGHPQKNIILPTWAFEVQDISWPSPGHFLTGAGGTVGVIDSNGKEVLRHVIKNLSFSPYHGPNGTSVRFDLSTKPYLAVMSHGSSGYPRSVLLIFNPDGQLVWQEEFNKARALLAVSRDDGQGEALLIGGMDGVIEYRLLQHHDAGIQKSSRSSEFPASS